MGWVRAFRWEAEGGGREERECAQVDGCSGTVGMKERRHDDDTRVRGRLYEAEDVGSMVHVHVCGFSARCARSCTR